MTRTRSLLLSLALIAASGASLAASAGPAAAGPCVTPGHAYFIYPANGFNYMSGFEGDQRYGVTTITAHRGDGFQLGGNGIKPRREIIFRATSGMFGGSANTAITTDAGSNCVVNQRDNAFTIGNVPNGTYTIRAEYVAGNDEKLVLNEPVVKVKIVS